MIEERMLSPWAMSVVVTVKGTVYEPPTASSTPSSMVPKSIAEVFEPSFVSVTVTACVPLLVTVKTLLNVVTASTLTPVPATSSRLR